MAKFQNEGRDENRRQFLKNVSGGVALALLLGATESEAADTETKNSVVLKLGQLRDLAKVGGYEIVQSELGKIIVARTGEASFVACEATCTHRSCEVEYNHGAQQFVCPCHNARFDLSGNVVKGPAKRPLKAYSADLNLIIGDNPPPGG